MPKGSLQESVLTFDFVGSKDLTNVIRLGSNHLYLLSHLYGSAILSLRSFPLLLHVQAQYFLLRSATFHLQLAFLLGLSKPKNPSTFRDTAVVGVFFCSHWLPGPLWTVICSCQWLILPSPSSHISLGTQTLSFYWHSSKFQVSSFGWFVVDLFSNPCFQFRILRQTYNSRETKDEESVYSPGKPREMRKNEEPWSSCLPPAQTLTAQSHKDTIHSNQVKVSKPIFLNNAPFLEICCLYN